MSVFSTHERLELRHLVNAPPDRVFEAWINPEYVEAWWGPDGFQTAVDKLDARVNGQFTFKMTAPSGAFCTMRGTYIEIRRPHRLVFEVHQHCITDLPDHVRAPSKPSMVEVTFRAKGGQTEICLIQTGLADDYQMLAQGGWGQSLERLARISGK